MKLKYVGFLPALCVLTWSIWYVGQPHAPTDLFYAFAVIVIAAFIVPVVIIGLMIACYDWT